MSTSPLDTLTLADLRTLAPILHGLVPQPTVLSAATFEEIAPRAEFHPERAVLVTTAHRGVFFGYARAVDGPTIALRAARNCLYWPRETKGFLGLATTGPTSGARIGPPADITLRDITCVAEVSEEAVKAWEAAPWAS